jgi:hypothetical protein
VGRPRRRVVTPRTRKNGELWFHKCSFMRSSPQDWNSRYCREFRSDTYLVAYHKPLFLVIYLIFHS